MLTKDLLVVKKRRPYIRPKYANDEGMARKVIEVYKNGEKEKEDEKKKEIMEEIGELENHENFKFVRGLSKLLERRCGFEEIFPDSKKLRGFLFERGYCTTEGERKKLMEEASLAFDIDGDMERYLWADREEEQILKIFEHISPNELLKRYNLSLTQTLLFDAIEMNFRVKENYQEIFRRIKFLGLIYRVEENKENDGYDIHVDGPASIFRKTTKYGSSLAKLLPTIIKGRKWEIKAKIETMVGGEPRIYNFELDDSKRNIFAGSIEEKFDSMVEKDFAIRFKSLEKKWKIKREPALIKVGNQIFIPDFGFEKGKMFCLMEIVGFWTDEYLEKKISKIKKSDVEMIIAVNKNLKCTKGEFGYIKDVIFYDKKIPIQPIINKLRGIEEKMREREARKLKGISISISRDIVSLKELAERYGVGAESITDAIPMKNHVLIGEKVVNLKFLDELKKEVDALPEKSYEEIEELLEGYGLTSAVLEKIGYKIKWNSLDGEKSIIVKVDTHSLR